MKKLLLLLLMALWAPSAMNAQTSLYSEGFEGGSMPTGWTQDSPGGWSIATGVNTYYPSTSGQGTRCAQIHAKSNTPIKLITPAIDLSVVSTAELSFMHVQQSFAGDVDGLKVYYRSSPSGTWTQLAAYDTAAYHVWTCENITLRDLSSTYQIAFEYIDNWGYGIGIDTVSIVTNDVCPQPTNLTCTLTQGDGTIADLNWTAGDHQIEWHVEYATNSDFTCSQTIVVKNTPSVRLTGLSLSTQYYVRVFAQCSFGAASISPSNAVTFTTEGLFTKEIVGYGNSTNRSNYYLIASPIGVVNPVLVNNMTNNQFDLYRFNQGADLEWENWKSLESEHYHFDLEPGMGYLYANRQDVTLTFHGYPIEHVAPVTLSVIDNKVLAGWNLVGNPYVLDAYIDRPFYRMNQNGTAINSETETGAILPMEGVFVMANENGETLTFTTEAPAKSPKLSLNLKQGNEVIDRAIIRFDEGKELQKFQFRNNSTKVYIPMVGEDFAVVRSEEMGEMPVSFKAEKNGSYTLGVNAENVEFGYLHLIDNLTGNDVDLLETPSYRFEAKTSDNTNRFKLVFASGNPTDDHFAFFSDGSLVIHNEGKALMNVFDVTGRLVHTQRVNGSCQVGFHAAPGVYTVQLVNGDHTRSQKIVVK